LDVYTKLGVTPVISAAGTLTRFGGALMLPEVVDAMVDASRASVDLNELHIAAGKRLAEMIGVEAAHVCSGAAAGIALMAAACMAGSDPKRIRQLPHTAGMRHRFVVQRAHRNSFDQSLRLSGGQFVEVEANTSQIESELRHPDVAAFYYTLSWFCTGEALPLGQAADLAHRAGVPLILDGAAQLPPAENLTRFLEEGVDLVTFSGGKALRGPQASGLVLGRRDLVEACRLNDNPNSGVGRPMKAGKEEIVGLIKAVELFLARDHAVERQVWERRVQHVIGALAERPHVQTCMKYPYGPGQQFPYVELTLDEDALGMTHQQLIDRMLAGRPRIALHLVTPQRYTWSGFDRPEIRIYMQMLRDGDEMIIARRLVEELDASTQAG
jgi:uncharacterized pyridoxal phosphate-dependent enzyme